MSNICRCKIIRLFVGADLHQTFQFLLTCSNPMRPRNGAREFLLSKACTCRTVVPLYNREPQTAKPRGDIKMFTHLLFTRPNIKIFFIFRTYHFPIFFHISASPADVADKVQNFPAEEEERVLPAGLRHELMPRHLAVIMDGNARWARRRGLPGSMGHAAGVQSLNLLVDMCGRWGIKVLTVFAFSSDNWNRPKVEIEFLMRLFETEIQSKLQDFLRKGIRISVIGNTSRLPLSLQKVIKQAEETTKENIKLQFIVALSYSGKYDIVQACKSLAQKVKDGSVDIENIDEIIFEKELETNCTEFPYPDLVIRTSGELRISNFFLWQLAYAELCFVSALWPDFGEKEFVAALTSFQKRDRRYGRRDTTV